MSVTVNVNGLSLCHMKSGGVSTATLPDVCKTPSPGGPVPIPYPNVAFSKDLIQGTKTVRADGGNSIAVKGSKFSTSIGDEPGTLGGVKSGVNKSVATWITYSFDVKMERKNACRLTDKMFHNKENTVNMAGLLQVPIAVRPEAQVVCEIICRCDAAPATGASGNELKQMCVSQALQALDDASGNRSTIKPEINYDMTQSPPSPIMSRANPLRGTEYLPGRTPDIPDFRPGAGMVRRPDVVVVRDGSMPPVQSNIKGVFEVKFPGDPWSEGQRRAYETIAGPNAEVTELSPSVCECPDNRRREPVRVPEPAKIDVWDVLLVVALVATVLTPIPGDEAGVAALGGARLARLAGAF